MIGGDQATVESLEPIFKILGSKWVRQGGAGAGQHTKMVNQTLIASLMVAICEGLLYAYKAGLDAKTVMESVTSGAAGSWSLNYYGPKIIDGNFDPGFFVEHFIKDMGIALEESRRMGISLPGLALAQQLYIALAAQGHAKSGTHSLMLALAKLSNIDWEHR
jgi:3-hydroxyisobutyrate dehydrogenase